MRAALLCVALATACSDDPPGLQLAGATPEYGPLAGGTTITLAGTGFAAPVRVLIGGREAPLATATSDTALQVVIPFGDRPGDAEIVVLTDRDTTRASGVFRYSAPPTISSITPADVLASSGTTRVSVTGSGFLLEGAGEVIVALGDQLATEVTIESDTQLSFVAPVGRLFAEPELVVSDTRGTTSHARALRYAPSMRSGLLLFPAFSAAFALFVDPLDHTVIEIPWVRNPEIRFTAVIRDDQGAYVGLDRGLRFGRLDLADQRLASPRQFAGWFPTVTRVGARYFALERSLLRFGELDPITGEFTPIGTTQIPCCGGYGLASNGTTLYLAARQGASSTLLTIDPETGAIGNPIVLTAAPGFQVEEMRFLDGHLYAAGRNSSVVEIDPATGIVTPMPFTIPRSTAMEVFIPR